MSKAGNQNENERLPSRPPLPSVANAVDSLLANGKVLRPVDVLVAMHLLDKQKIRDWQAGRIPYLEKVVSCNLTRASRILTILRLCACNLGLKPSFTAYMRLGKGPKARLRFSKSGQSAVENSYSTHFVPLATAQDPGLSVPPAGRAAQKNQTPFRGAGDQA